MDSRSNEKRNGDASLTQTATNVSMSAELFEKLYLNPKTPRVTDYDRRFANASPLGFLGLVICTLTFSMLSMGWGGAGNMNAIAGMFIFTGPVLFVLSTIFLWIQGQFFPMMICGLFSAFWLSLGLLQFPTLGLAASYAAPTSAAGSAIQLAAEGSMTKEYNAALALYLIVWGFVIFTFWIFTWRLNLVLVGILGLTHTASFVLSASYWAASNGEVALAKRLQKTGGALIFMVGLLGWYMLLIMMAAEMRLTIRLPAGDLSHLWRQTDIELGQLEKSAD